MRHQVSVAQRSVTGGTGLFDLCAHSVYFNPQRGKKDAGLGTGVSFTNAHLGLRRNLRCERPFRAPLDEQGDEVAHVRGVEAVVRLGDGSVDDVGGCGREGCCEVGFHLIYLTFFFGGSHIFILAFTPEFLYWSSNFFGEVLSTSASASTAFIR